jgi:ribonuclease T2
MIKSATTAWLALSLALKYTAAAASCPDDVLSCSSSAAKVDPCCTPSPAGLFLFKQRFEPDIEVDGGKWGIEGLDVLK